MRRVLLTGITGFAGSHLAERLVERGDEVHGIAFEAPPHAYLAAVETRVTVHAADVLDEGAMGDVVRSVRPDVIVHLAGQAVPTIAAADPLAAIRVNVLGTAHVASAARAAGGVRLVVASSADVYGIPDEVPSTEAAPLNPQNVYAASKVAAEAVVRGLASAAPVAILRPCNQIGPRLHPRLVASEFARRIAEAEAGSAEPVIRHGQLDPRREFLDVRDMAAAYDAAMDLADDGVRTYNVGSGAAVPVSELLETLLALARVPIRTELDPERVRAGVPDALLLDSSLFRGRTGWRPAIPLERSLSDTLDFWRERVLEEGDRGPKDRPPYAGRADRGARTEVEHPVPREGSARPRDQVRPA